MTQLPAIIDTHAHFEELSDPQVALEEARRSGVVGWLWGRILNPTRRP